VLLESLVSHFWRWELLASFRISACPCSCAKVFSPQPQLGFCFPDFALLRIGRQAPMASRHQERSVLEFHVVLSQPLLKPVGRCRVALPNRRLRRTRSALLRSPLRSKPLGNEKS